MLFPRAFPKIPCGYQEALGLKGHPLDSFGTIGCVGPGARIVRSGSAGFASRLTALGVVLCLALPAPLVAQDTELISSVALLDFDALGMDTERVGRLETLFQKEVERLTGRKLPSKKAFARLPARIRRCDGKNECLAQIGRLLHVEAMLSGNVAALDDSYVLNIKLVDSKSGQQLRRVQSDPLRGNPDELIEAMRVAAYRLLAPHKLTGAITILADRKGATVTLDGKTVGKTPIEKPIDKLALGKHSVHVKADEYGEFETEVEVRFQKATPVVVSFVDLRVARDPVETAPTVIVRPPPDKWYNSTWLWVSTGVGAVVVGALLGRYLSRPDIVACPGGGSCAP